MKNHYLLFCLLILFSCTSDDCINDIVGIYSGTCTSSTGTLQGDLIISESPEGASKLLIQDGVSALSGFMGTLSGNCKKISISSQPVVNINGAGFFISGTLHVNGSSIIGDLAFEQGTTVNVCSYDLMKN